MELYIWEIYKVFGLQVHNNYGKFYKIESSISRMMSLRKKRKNRKAAIEMSFPFIFSAILVAVVLFVGFFVIKMFLDYGEKAKIQTAVADIKSKVDEVSSSYGQSDLMSFKLSSKIEAICFVDMSGVNGPCKNPSGFSNFCRDYSSFAGTRNNMFIYPAKAAWDFKLGEAYEIYCGTESQKKQCLDLSTSKCFMPDLDGKISFRVTKPNEESQVKIMAP